MCYWNDPTPLSGGTNVTIRDNPPMGDLRAVLWLPDPEQRHGWREWYVRDAAAKPQERRFGFTKPGSK